MNQEKNLLKKPDRRVIKTKRAICNAFVELISKREINDITIKDIADKADVNRKTVYNYYCGIHEILDEIENKLVTSFEEVIKEIDFSKREEAPYRIFDALTRVLNSNLDFYGYLLVRKKNNVNSQLSDKIISILTIKIKKAFLEQHLFVEEKLDLIVTFVVNGMISAYQLWFNSDRKVSLEDFSNDVSKLVFSSFSDFYIK